MTNPELARLQRVLALHANLPTYRARAVQSLLDSGWSYGKIAKATGVSRAAVWGWAHPNNLTSPDRLQAFMRGRTTL